MTSAKSEQLEKAAGPSRRPLALLVGLLATLALIVSGTPPTAAQNAVGAQPVAMIFTVGPHQAAGPESTGAHGPPQLRQVSATGVAADSGFDIVGGGVRTRAIDYTPNAADSSWGLTRAHLDKHMFGSGKYSLGQIDPRGNSDIWFGHMQDLASRPATATLKGGIEDIIGTFPRTGESGTFQFGIRVAPNGGGGYDLVTLLTRQP